MTRNVLVSISGNQFAMGQDVVEIVTTGVYFKKNENHYVMYEVQEDPNAALTMNRAKFRDGHFELTKRGEQNGFLAFDRNHKTENVYQTPVGPLQVDVTTSALDITETENEICIQIRYGLEINYQFISDCEVQFKIETRGTK